MIILALDISKRRTGAAVGVGANPPHTTSQAFTGETMGAVGAAYTRWLRDKLRVDKPDLVAFEAPLLSAQAKGSTDTLMILSGLCFTTMTLCSIHKIRCVSVAVSTWRKAFIGHGFPTDPKAAALSMCASLGWTPRNHDEAEACGVWAWAHVFHGDIHDIHRQLSASSMKVMAR